MITLIVMGILLLGTLWAMSNERAVEVAQTPICVDKCVATFFSSFAWVVYYTWLVVLFAGQILLIGLRVILWCIKQFFIGWVWGVALTTKPSKWDPVTKVGVILGAKKALVKKRSSKNGRRRIR